MFHLVYVSSAVNLFSNEQLEQLLEVSRINNSKCGVTGMLLYLEGNFIQALEGEKEDVLRTSARIEQDPRHRGVLVLLQGDIEKRDFPNWSMGYRRVARDAEREIPGYNDFLHRKNDPEMERSSAIRLMEHFRKINC